MPDFTNIPRTSAEVVDFGTRVTPPVVGPKVTVLGFTDNPSAPLEDPFLLERLEDLSTLFDRATAAQGPSEITKMVEEVASGGGRNIEVFVLSDGSGNRYDEGSVTPAQRYSMLARAYELLINHDVDIVIPIDAKIDMTGLAALQNFGWQLANFCYQATKEYNSCIGVVGVQPPSAAVAVTGIPSLALQNSWVNALVGYNTAALLGSDITIYDGTTDSGGDGVPDNFAFWATTDEVIPVGAPPASAANIRRDAKGNPIDIGGYISVVASWAKIRNEAAARLYPTEGYYNAGGEGVYGGLISSLPAEISTTNMPASGAEVLRNLSARQVNSLSGSRYVSFWTMPNGFVVASGMTGAHNVSQYYRSDFVRLTTVRITQDAIAAVRIVSNPFIGKPNNAVNRSALENAIDEGLSRLQKRGALEGFRFSIISTPTMRVLGQIIVDLTIVPAFEIQEITVQIGLSAA
jgi:hypothetical protein